MSYENKYYATYQNHPKFSSIWTVYIATDDDYSGSLINITMAGEPVFVNFEGTASNIYAPVRASSAELRIKEFTDDSLIELFEKDRAGLVKIYRDGTMYWAGWTTYNSYQSAYTMCPKEIRIMCVDGLTFMKNQSLFGVMDVPRGVGTYQLITYLYACLNWVGLDLQLYESINIWADGQSKTGRPLEQLWLPYWFFIKDRSTMEMDTLYDAVEKIVKGFGATLKQRHGRWYLDRPKQYLENTITYRAYTSAFVYSTIHTENLVVDVTDKSGVPLVCPINMSLVKSFDNVYKKLTTTVDYKESPNLIKSWLDFDIFGTAGIFQYYIMEDTPSIMQMGKKGGVNWDFATCGGIKYSLGEYHKSTRTALGFWVSENMNNKPFFKIRMVGHLFGPNCALHAQLRLVSSSGSIYFYSYNSERWYKSGYGYGIDSMNLWVDNDDLTLNISDGDFDSEVEVNTWQAEDLTLDDNDGSTVDMVDGIYDVYFLVFAPGRSDTPTAGARANLDLAQLEVNIADGVLTKHDIIREQTVFQGEDALFETTLYSEPNYAYIQMDHTPINFIPQNDPYWGSGSLMNPHLVYPGMLFIYAGGTFTPVRLYTEGNDTTKYMLEYIVLYDIMFFYFNRRWVLDGTILGEIDIGALLRYEGRRYMIDRMIANTKKATQEVHLIELFQEEEYLLEESSGGAGEEIWTESSGGAGEEIII
jgi:hypothetical protein